MTRILIADDHPIIVSGLEAVLADTGYEVVGSVADGLDVPEAVDRTQPDLLLLDVSMPGCGGVEALRTLRARGDARPVVLLTAGLEDKELIEAVQLGVDGIVLKEGAHKYLVPCLDSVRAGGRWIEQSLLQRALDLSLGGGIPADPFHPLTERERAIARLVAEGLRNRDIAGRLAMNEGTVKVYLHRIYKKLGVASRTELAIRARA
ncbi:MAG TPA: response regulator transcription factor [Allosphingosinicella sp.]|nr:response regulator transcription factor [Allosphingosinicella sp.]